MNLVKLSFISFLISNSFVSAYSAEISAVVVELTSYESENITRPTDDTNLKTEGMKIVYKVSLSINGKNKKILIPNIFGTTEEVTLSLGGSKNEDLMVQSRVLDEVDDKEIVNSCGPFTISITQDKPLILYAKFGVKYLNKQPTAGSSVMTMNIHKVIR